MKKIAGYYSKTILFTGILAGLFSFLFQNIKIDEQISGLLLTMAVQFAPGIAYLTERNKTKEKLNFQLKVDKWFMLSIIIPIILLLITGMILSLIGIAYQHSIYTGPILGIAIVTTILGSIGEEVGWRGYLENELNKSHSLFTSSMITGLMWGIWHFFKIVNNGLLSYLLFIPTILLFGILMGYIYNRSNHSLINTVLFHSFVNITTILILFNREGIPFYIVLTGVELITVFALWVIDKGYFRSKK